MYYCIFTQRYRDCYAGVTSRGNYCYCDICELQEQLLDLNPKMEEEE